MEIKQFYDYNLAHASYAVISENEIALIDPSRNPHQYYNFARERNAKIVAVIETHPHADFVSSHAEISKTTGAKIYVSKLVKPHYDFIPFDEGDVLKLGKIELRPINTPGHSPDSISILIKDEHGKDYAIATGDTLFVGDVGRPDLRESAGNINKSKEDLARMMYRTINEKLLTLPDETLVFPAHGAGSLCGKASSSDTYTTIGRERKENYALQPMPEDEFVNELLKNQSYIPKYFSHSVALNSVGAPDFDESISKVKKINSYDEIEKGIIVIDARPMNDFGDAHYKGAINLADEFKFETWLGTIVSPQEKFYLISDTEQNLQKLIERTASIGYESNIKGAMVHDDDADDLETSVDINIDYFKNHQNDYTIIDVRNQSERDYQTIFKNSLLIPLNELRESADKIPLEKPLVVHCAGGYRGAAAAGIIERETGVKVYNLGDQIRLFSDN